MLTLIEAIEDSLKGTCYYDEWLELKEIHLNLHGPGYPQDYDNTPVAKYFHDLPNQYLAKKLWQALGEVMYCCQQGMDLEITFKSCLGSMIRITYNVE